MERISFNEMQLERGVDEHGINAILEALADICNEKAEHIRESYSVSDSDTYNEVLSDDWDGAAIRIREFAEELDDEFPGITA